MKKVTVILLVVLMIGAMSTTAFAAKYTDLTNPVVENITVNGFYSAAPATDVVYSIDVTWGSMNFTYTPASDGTWNPTLHQYESPVAASWSAEGNTITVTNHSNAGVKASFLFEANPELGFNNIKGSFSKTSFELDTAVKTGVNDAPSDSTTFTVTGGTISADSELGLLSITLMKLP